MEKVNVIAESSWDLECIKSQGFKINRYIMHNDYFSEKGNFQATRMFNRIKAVTVIFIFVIHNYFRKEKLLFASFNFECLMFAWLLNKKRNLYFFCSNVMANPEKYKDRGHLRLAKLLSKYKGRVLVTDEVTKKSLANYDPILTKNHYIFNVPKATEANGLTYIIVMPAVLSHNNTRTKHDLYYTHAMYIINWLKFHNYKFKILPHPREEGQIKSEDIKLLSEYFISNDAISILGNAVCYLSSFSSLSLNRRYGGDYGFWVKVPDIRLLPTGYKEDLALDLEVLNG